MKKQKSLGEQVQEAVKSSEQSQYAIAKKAGVRDSSLQRVMSEDWGRQLDTAKKILNAVEMDLVIVKQIKQSQ